MPTIPRAIKCRELGCVNTRSVLSTACLEHGGRDVYIHKASAQRKENNSKYQTTQWKKLRSIQLSTHPLCASCLSRGIVTPAQHIDHIFPWSKIGESAFFKNIFQSLCGGCHSVKTLAEKRGIYTLYTHTGQINYKLSDYPRVMANNEYRG